MSQKQFLQQESDDEVDEPLAREEAKTPAVGRLLTKSERFKLLATAPNQEIGRILVEIYPIVSLAIKCYFQAMNEDANFLSSRFHAALML